MWRSLWAGGVTEEIALPTQTRSQTLNETTGLRPRSLLRPDPVFIIGMHRSGTSALGCALENLGLTVGKNVMPPRPENPRGFAENLSVVKMNDRFLAALGSDWKDPKPLSDACFAHKAAGRFRKKLHSLLVKEFGAGRPLIKDPRMCRLLPLWRPFIEEHFPHAAFILAVRHPLEVAQSLYHRQRLPLDQGLKLWIIHTLEGERNTRVWPRLLASYDQLLQTPAETVHRLGRALSLSTEKTASEVVRPIDGALRHHQEHVWPSGLVDQPLALAIHEAFVSGKSVCEEALDLLRADYYERMGWHEVSPALCQT